MGEGDMEENYRERNKSWNEAVAVTRDRADWGRLVNGPVLPEE